MCYNIIMCTQNEMPIVEAVKNYLAANYARLHMPGHKGKCVPEIISLLGDKPFQMDLTEIPGLDDLHRPIEAIAKAEDLAARLFGAANTIFVVNGATQGITSLMMLEQGQKVILPRHAHKALYNGLILSGAEPVYVRSNYLPFWDVAQGLNFEHFCTLVSQNPDVKQVWLTSPTYFGHTEDISAYKKHLPKQASLFVDEAHGSHLRLMGKNDAMKQGADAAVQSWHKTLGSLTQSAVIHFSNQLLAQEIRKIISLTETTSPSYLLLVSLDAARQNIAVHGKEIIQEALENAEDLRLKLASLENVSVMPTEDITKIAVSYKGVTGYELSKYLQEQGIMPEMAQKRFVLLQASLYFSKKISDKIFKAIKMFNPSQSALEKDLPQLPEIPVMVFTPRQAFYKSRRAVPFKEALGKVSAEFIIPYPPGIPVIAPGELITYENLSYLESIHEMGCRFQGIKDLTLQRLEVITE